MLVVADENRLRMTPWNIAYGNKIAHLLFLVSLCAKQGAELVIPCASCLDEIFDLEPNKRALSQAAPCIYREISAFSAGAQAGPLIRLLRLAGLPATGPVKSAVVESRRQVDDEIAFLNRTDLPEIFSVTGHFWHYQLMPEPANFTEFLRIRPDVRDFVENKYPDIAASHSVAVHIRDTDFSRHLDHIFTKSILIDDGYYLRAMQHMERRTGMPLRYHLFSDNMDRAERLFRGKDYIVHDDNAACDWVGLLLARNVIQSNSTFCWTASLYNKDRSIQPAGGYAYHYNVGNVPSGFLMPFSDVIGVGGSVAESGLKYAC